MASKSIPNGCSMLTRDAHSSGHLVPPHLGLAYALLVETSPFPNLVVVFRSLQFENQKLLNLNYNTFTYWHMTLFRIKFRTMDYFQLFHLVFIFAMDHFFRIKAIFSASWPLSSKKKTFYFCSIKATRPKICKKSVCFYCITTSLWRTQVNDFFRVCIDFSKVQLI